MFTYETLLSQGLAVSLRDAWIQVEPPPSEVEPSAKSLEDLLFRFPQTLNLTGQVQKVGDRPVAEGGFARVWRGIWLSIGLPTPSEVGCY
jgi:hypothetical protein